MLRLLCRAQGEPGWARPDDMPHALWRILHARGVRSAGEADAFLNPSERDLLDPMRLSGMADAVARIREVLNAREAICVWGDYDVDGVSAAAILTGVLKELGGDAFAYIPSRHAEGYGLNEQGVVEVARRAKLLITVDCGVSALAQIARAQQLGLSVIVTDHHRPGEALPACIVVNPLLDGYGNPALCGAGVAFKLALALDERLARPYIDLAALATVADVVSLTGENRALVKLGLDAMNEQPRLGIEALMAVAGIKPASLSAGKLAFQIAPRLNAGGRVGSAERALKLLMTQSRDEADALAQELERENTARRQMEARIIREAEAQLSAMDIAHMRAIVLSDDDWNSGVVGLAASRLVERYNLPAVLLAGSGDQLTGSCRSIPGVDIFECLTAVAPLLTRYGGHKQAAGLTIERANIDRFRAALNDAVIERADEDVFVPRAEYDLPLSLGELDLDLLNALERLQPTGFGNPAPVFMTDACVNDLRAVGQDGAHLQLTLEDGDARVRGVWFGAGARAGRLGAGERAVLYVPRADAYMGRVSLGLEVKAMGAVAGEDALRLDDANQERLLHLFLTHRLYNKELSEGERADIADVAQLCAWLRASPRGTLVAAADAHAASAVLKELDDAELSGRLDVYEGVWPDDRRGFNALCVLPSGETPRGYERVVALGAPACVMAPGFDGAAFEMGKCAQWVRALPDRDALRALYVAVREMLRRPYAAKEAGVLARELSELCGLAPASAHAGLYALRELGLIDFEWGTRPLAMRRMTSVEPDDSPAFRLFASARTWGGAGRDR